MVRNIYRLIKHKKMIKMKKNVTPGKTPEKITVSMIDEDLNNGITKPEMAIKYGIKSWEIAEMFKHPFLKGRRPSKKKPLSFSFVDDVSEDIPGFEGTKEQLEEVDPNQVTLEQAIDEAIDTVEEAKDQMQQTQEAIVDMLSPTDPDETIEDILDIMVNKDGQSLKETFDKEIAAGNIPEEEELEMEDDTFDL